MQVVKSLSLPEELWGLVDAQRGDVARSRFVQRALEKALSDAQGSTSLEQAGPDPVVSSEAVRPAAPSRTSSALPRDYAEHPAGPAVEPTPLPKIAARRNT